MAPASAPGSGGLIQGPPFIEAPGLTLTCQNDHPGSSGGLIQGPPFIEACRLLRIFFIVLTWSGGLKGPPFIEA